MAPDLGSVRQWLVEWTASGAALGGGVPALTVAVIAAIDPSPLFTVLEIVVPFALVGALAGAAIGALAATPVRAATIRLWALHPIAALLLGPLLGAVGGGLLAPILVAGPLGEPTVRAVTAAALAGGSCAGLTLAPVWVAYVALHARGREGWGALGVALVWAPVTVAGTLGSMFLYFD